MLQKNHRVQLKFVAELCDQGGLSFEDEVDIVGRIDVPRAIRERALIRFLDLLDRRALFREEVKPRLAAHPEVGAYNQEI